MAITVALFRERLRGWEASSGEKEATIARKCGLNLTTYRAVKDGGEQGPSLSTVLRMMESLGPEVVWQLLTGTEPPAQQGAPSFVIYSGQHPDHFSSAFSPKQYAPIPLLKNAVAHRLASEVLAKDIEGWAMVYASQDWMPTDPDQYTCACVRDRSMYPVLDIGDIVAIDHSAKDPAILDGKMVALHTSDGVTVRWLKLKGDVVVGVPENRDELDQVVVLKGDEIKAGIVGAVRWWWGKR